MGGVRPDEVDAVVQYPQPGNHLLAIDLGQNCGTAMFGPTGQLLWYRAQQLAEPAAQRRAAARTMADPRIGWILSSGDVSLGAIWERIAMRQGVRVQRVGAAAWRASLLPEVAGASLSDGRRAAQALARQIIDASDMPAPGALADDAAAAILIGLWGVMQMGWLRAVPQPRRTGRRRATDASA